MFAGSLLRRSKSGKLPEKTKAAGTARRLLEKV